MTKIKIVFQVFLLVLYTLQPNVSFASLGRIDGVQLTQSETNLLKRFSEKYSLTVGNSAIFNDSNWVAFSRDASDDERLVLESIAVKYDRYAASTVAHCIFSAWVALLGLCGGPAETISPIAHPRPPIVRIIGTR